MASLFTLLSVRTMAQKEEEKIYNQYKKYCKKYLNKRVNFIVRTIDKNGDEIKYKLNI